MPVTRSSKVVASRIEVGDIWNSRSKEPLRKSFSVAALESLKGKRGCRQVKFYSGVSRLTSRWSCLSRILARRLNPAVLHPSQSNCRIRLAGLRRRLARSLASSRKMSLAMNVRTTNAVPKNESKPA